MCPSIAQQMSIQRFHVAQAFFNGPQELQVWAFKAQILVLICTIKVKQLQMSKDSLKEQNSIGILHLKLHIWSFRDHVTAQRGSKLEPLNHKS